MTGIELIQDKMKEIDKRLEDSNGRCIINDADWQIVRSMLNDDLLEFMNHFMEFMKSRE